MDLFGHDWKVDYLPPSRLEVQVNKEFHLRLHFFFRQLYEDALVTVSPRINKYARCSVNGLSLTSDLHGSDRSSIVKAYFAIDDMNEADPYFGVVHFFFTSVILIRDREVEKVKSHDLAYVQWFKFHNPAQDPLSELFQVTNDFYEGDEIISPRHFVSRCALLKPFRNSRYHFVVDLPASCSHN